ncbi:MAG TPA: tRNA lysidine(34) synthetase TilS [Kofleriaceae bacterium]|nr:tRNA lysidine(34) synthetase TilS [Kofleriaceae bacterium]
MTTTPPVDRLISRGFPRAKEARGRNPAFDPSPSVIAAVNAQIRRVGPGLYGVACSGGADSLALADATIRAAGAANVLVLTIDHGLTPASAAASEAVATWARGRGVVAVVRRVEVERRGSLEAAARAARYAALETLAEQLGLVCVLVGHTARDQAETVVLRLLRGTGPAGLAGIPVQRGRFLRPFLSIERDAIDAYVRTHALPVWEDPMNDDRRHARVRVRQEILPVLRHENPQLDTALVRLARSAAEWLEVIDALARPFARFPIDRAALAAQPAAVRKRALSLALEVAGLDYDAVHLEHLDRMITAPERGQISIDVRGGSIVRSYGTLSIAPGHASTPSQELVTLEERYDLRVWRAGDRMKPARLKGRSRKLSDLYIDAKVPRSARTTARVLVRRSDATIVWAEHLGAAVGESFGDLPIPAQSGGKF